MDKEDKPAKKRKFHTQEEKLFIFGKVIEILEDSLVGTREACKRAGVSRECFRVWVRENEEFRKKYDEALEGQAEVYEQRLIAITSCEPQYTSKGVVDSGDVAHRKLQADTLKWLMEKKHRKIYGNSVELTGNAEAPLFFSKIETVFVDSKNG